MPNPPRQRWLVSYRYQPTFYYPDGTIKRGSEQDHIAIWDQHPLLMVAQSRARPPVRDMVESVNVVTRIYSAFPVNVTSSILEAFDD